MIVSYERVSTDMQENGIQQQRHEIEKYCQYKDIELDKTFTDFGVSGKHFDRDEFNEMIELVKQGEIEEIIITELSRWGRNMLEALQNIQILKKHKCNLVVLKENIHLDSPSGNLLTNILFSLAEWEREQISYRTKKVLQDKKEQGLRYTQSTYGYDVKGGKMVENKKEQFMLKKVQNLKDKGYSYNEIKDFLNRNGYKKKNNTDFNRDNVVKLFRNHIN